MYTTEQATETVMDNISEIINPNIAESKTEQINEDDNMRDSLHILPNQEAPTNNPYTIPYQRWIGLQNNIGSILARGTVDAGSQANVLDAGVWAANEHLLGSLEPSKTLLRVADGKASRCIGRWKGMIRLETEEWEVIFEVFDSRGAFEVLLGKPWLTQAKAVQSFDDDTLWLPGAIGALRNEYPLVLKEEFELEETAQEEAIVEEEIKSKTEATREEVMDNNMELEPVGDEEYEGQGEIQDKDVGRAERRIPAPAAGFRV